MNSAIFEAGKAYTIIGKLPLYPMRDDEDEADPENFIKRIVIDSAEIETSMSSNTLLVSEDIWYKEIGDAHDPQLLSVNWNWLIVLEGHDHPFTLGKFPEHVGISLITKIPSVGVAAYIDKWNLNPAFDNHDNLYCRDENEEAVTNVYNAYHVTIEGIAHPVIIHGSSNEDVCLKVWKKYGVADQPPPKMKIAPTAYAQE
jgi:hypothetical protein